MRYNCLSALITCFLIICLLFFLSLEEIVAQKIDFISIESLHKHMDSIASDKTEGRFTASLGYKKAANYAKTVFQRAELEPGWINEKGKKTYFQPVPFIRNSYDTSTSLTISKKGKKVTFDHSVNNFVIINPGTNYKNMPMDKPVFIGFGIHEPDFGWDDYADLDLKGKWVILLSGLPSVDSINDSFSGHLHKLYAKKNTQDSLKYKALIKHKVAGVVILPDKHTTENWEKEALRKYRYNYIHYVGSNLNVNIVPKSDLPCILVHPGVAQILMKDQVYDPISHKGNYCSFVLENIEIDVNIDCKKEVINCYNIIAIVQGTDSSLKNKYITVGAHLDHLGKMGNHIYNGANDDASGCAIILEAAKAIAQNPTKKSILFILYTSEEQGLIGSKYFLENSPVPIHRILLNINIEQIGSKNRDFPGIWVISPPEFNEAFQKVSNSFDKTYFKFDPINKYKDALSTCDLWSYYQKDIPAIMLSSGGFPEHHKPEDKIDLIDFEHLYIAAKFLYSYITELGNTINH